MSGCERCGRLDASLRASAFQYVVSIIFVTYRRGSVGVYCSSCRKKEALKWSSVSALLGWWGIPWGPVYTLGALSRNGTGAVMDSELNGDLLQAVAAELMEQGDSEGAVQALEESLRLKDDPAAREALWSLKGEAVTAASSAPSLVTPETAPVSTLQYAPGAVVRTLDDDVPVMAAAGDSGEPVGVLGSETAIVTRVDGGWIEIRIPGGAAGWVPATEITSA